jgi:hypothetical protein
LIDVRDCRRPQRQGPVADAAPQHPVALETVENPLEVVEAADLVKARNWNILVAKEDIQRMFVLAKVDRRPAWQEQFERKTLTRVGQRLQDVFVGADDQIDPFACDYVEYRIDEFRACRHRNDIVQVG